MLYKMQLVAYQSSGLLASTGDSFVLGKFNVFPVKLVLDRIHTLKNDLSLMNLACGLLPSSIETNRLRVVILVLDENLDSIAYTEMYEYKHN